MGIELATLIMVGLTTFSCGVLCYAAIRLMRAGRAFEERRLNALLHLTRIESKIRERKKTQP